jgi:hypothetical protein
MAKPGQSRSKAYYPRLKTRNSDNSTVSELVNDSASDQHEEGQMIKIVGDIE